MKESTLCRPRWPATSLTAAVASIDVKCLAKEFGELVKNAPRRSSVHKQYFVDHTGVPGSSKPTNRLEEHCAIALCNLDRRWPRADGGWFGLLDYQVPLYARQADKRRKIDLLGVTDQGRLVIHELKVKPKSGGRGDAPPAALMEGLRYAACVQADLEAIVDEARRKFDVDVSNDKPIVQVVAPVGWWEDWLSTPVAGAWGPVLADLSESLTDIIGVPIEYIAFEDVDIEPGIDGTPPRISPQAPRFFEVELRRSRVGKVNFLPQTRTQYSNEVFASLWSWADRNHHGQLDGGPRIRRPPVLLPDFADENVLVPSDRAVAAEIRSLIPRSQRHRHFGSLKSSQALAQSVFGALVAGDRLDLLDDINAECDRPAFAGQGGSASIEFEHAVFGLGEQQGRQTSIDVLMATPSYRVAIECKFTEEEFGTCSRPKLKPKDKTFADQRCNGNYRAQAGRLERCALTSIGIEYWKYLPHLFDWPRDRDRQPCVFGSTYQLARNALGVSVSADGAVDPDSGHVLVIYDERNPAFAPGGEAMRQWEDATEDCLVPGLLRRVSWQQIIGHLAGLAEMDWLIEALREKYGLLPA